MRWLARHFEELVSGFALLAVLVLVIVNVLIRFLFSISLNWVEELAAIGFAWTVFVGASACYKRKLHVGIDTFVNMLPHRLQRSISLTIGLMMIVVNLYLCYASLVFSVSAWLKPTAVLLIPYTFVDISATVGFGMMCIHSIRFFIHDLKADKVYISS